MLIQVDQFCFQDLSLTSEDLQRGRIHLDLLARRSSAFRRKFLLQRFYFVLGFLHSFLLNDLLFRVGLLLSVTVLIALLQYAQLSTTFLIFLFIHSRYYSWYFFFLNFARFGYIRH